MAYDLSYEWLSTLYDIITNGREVAPRGQPTRELLQRTLHIDMRRPVLTVPARKLGYRFMAAEAYWILTGDNRVSTIAPYSRRISEFSDDGQTFFGAYGPKIMAQLQYVITALRRDRDTRQAGLTIWRESPPETKDVPCTVAIFFNIRDTKLNCHVFMRSSDVWLGVPYDVFNFSMLSHLVCGCLNIGREIIVPGTLYLTAASSHIYERNVSTAQECLTGEMREQPPTPEALYTNVNTLLTVLKDLRDTDPNDSHLRWWTHDRGDL